MKVSVVLICYNQELFIEQALLSLERQSVMPTQLIIGDDCSSDSTYKKVVAFKKKSQIEEVVCFSNNRNLGIVGNLNKAISYVNGDIIFFQAGDDLSESNRIEKTIAVFENSKASMILTSYNIIDEFGNIKKQVLRNGFYNDSVFFIKKGAGIPPFGCALNLKKLDHSLFIPHSLRNEDDYLSFLSALNSGVQVIKDVLYTYRINTGVSSWAYSKDITRSTLVNKYKEDLPNRLENYIQWRQLMPENNYVYAKKLLNLRIEMIQDLIARNELSANQRVEMFLKYRRIASIREKAILLFGLRILFDIAKIKRFFLGI